MIINLTHLIVFLIITIALSKCMKIIPFLLAISSDEHKLILSDCKQKKAFDKLYNKWWLNKSFSIFALLNRLS